MRLIPKNWDTFQHYKDRSPAWIKLHRGLLDNREYHSLSSVAAKYLPLIWLIASEKDGTVPEAGELGFRLRLDVMATEKILTELVAGDFLVNADDIQAEHAEHDATLAQRIAKNNGFGSRHISDEVRRAVWERDEGKCRTCGSNLKIEYDHIHPVSKGGNSGIDNIQLLCRPCNRAKRVSVATPAQPLRSLEKRREEIEEEKNIRAVAIATRTPDRFEEFWKLYPKREGANPKSPARKKFLVALKAGATADEILAATKRFAEAERKLEHIGTPYVPMATTWLNQQRWGDYAPVNNGASPSGPPDPSMPTDEELRKRYGARQADGLRKGVGQDQPPEGEGILQQRSPVH